MLLLVDRSALKSRLGGYRRLAIAEVVPLVSFFAASALALLFGLLAEEVAEGDTRSFDQSILLAFRTNGDIANPIGPPWLEEAARDVTALGSHMLLGFLTLAIIGFLMLMRKRGLAAFVAASVSGGMLISTFLKISFHRARPDMPHAARVFTASFPSGHATLSAVVFLTLSVLLARVSTDGRLKIYFVALAIFLTVAVGVSRIYLRLHYPSDVLAGWCVGAAWALLCWAAALLIQRRIQMRRVK
jgi:undecaprenyl-diphosphatase